MNITARPQALIAIASTITATTTSYHTQCTLSLSNDNSAWQLSNHISRWPPPLPSPVLPPPCPPVCHSPSVYFSVSLILCESLETRALTGEDACFCVARSVILGPRPLTVGCPFHVRIACVTDIIHCPQRQKQINVFEWMLDLQQKKTNTQHIQRQNTGTALPGENCM